jgi:threonyl-tRNA synthetase
MIHRQRIYGTAWLNETELKASKLQQEQARARDHRLIGQQLDLFSIQEDAGGGLVFWHPKGSTVRRIIEEYWKQEHIKVHHLLEVVAFLSI